MPEEDVNLKKEMKKVYAPKKKGYTGKHHFPRPSTAKETAGKVDYIEDMLGTEELKGTYEARTDLSQKMAKEKLLMQEWRAKREARMRKEHDEVLMKELKDTGRFGLINQQLDFLLPYVLEPLALEYLIKVYQTDPDTARGIFWHLLPPKELKKLDTYVERIVAVGHGPKERIKIGTIMKLERYIRGIKPTIMVERDGKREELGAHKIV